MRDRFGALLEGRSYISVLAAWAASLLTIAVGFLAGVALAQDDGGGDVNIHASDCSQVQAIFIRQFLNNDDVADNGGTTAETTATITTAASEQYDEAAAKISQRINITQKQVLICLNVGAGGTTNGDTTNATTSEETTAETTGGDGGDQEQVTICHDGTDTITVDVSALETHLAHGDRVGTCDTTNGGTTNATTTGTATVSTTPNGEVIAGSIPNKELPNTGGLAVLAPAGALLAIAAGVGLLLAVRRR